MKKIFVSFLLLAAFGCHRSNSNSEAIAAIQIQDRNGITETISTPERLEVYQAVDFLSAQPYKKILRVFKAEGKNRAKITTYHPNGSIWQYLEAEEMRAMGAYREWHPNGQLKLEATVIGGTADVAPGTQADWLFDGLSRVWDEQGRLVAEIPYQKGMLQGKSLYFYPSGQVERELSYFNNNLEGISLEYFPSGALKSKIAFKSGDKEGASLGFFESGQKSWVEDYVKGYLKTGAYYDPRGAQVSAIENGGGRQALFEGEALSFLVEFRFGHPEGFVKQFTPSGELLRTYSLKNNKKVGEEIDYYLLSELESATQQIPRVSIHWNDNTIHGRVKTWYNNGQLQSEREYCRNQKMGPSLAWYRGGALMMVEEYEEDQLIKGSYYKLNQRDPSSSISNGNGIASLFDENGVFLRKVTYLKGKPVDPES